MVGRMISLVVLAGGQGEYVLAVAQHDEAGLFALQELLDDDARAALVVRHAVLVVHQHEIHGVVGLLQRHRHHHALAGGQAVGLDDDGRAQAVHEGVGCCGVGEGVVVRRGDAVTAHEGLAERLGAFELRGGLRRAKDAQAVRAELVHHACAQARRACTSVMLTFSSLGFSAVPPLPGAT